MNGDETPSQRLAVLDAAERLTRDEGADGWTLPELGKAMGLTLAEIGADFESEWDVFRAIMQRDEDLFEEALAVPKGASASDRIVAIFEATVPDFDWSMWIELWSFALRDDRARTLCHKFDERFRGILEEVIQSGVASGEFQCPDTRRAAITISTLIDALATQATLGDTTIRPNYMLDACVTVAGELLEADLKLRSLGESDG